MIEWLRLRHGMSFPEACREVGGAHAKVGGRKAATPAVSQVSGRLDGVNDGERWRARGMRLVEQGEGCLWGGEGESARAYLRRRGLKEATIRRYRLGYLAETRRERGEVWGLPEQSGWVWLPRGITIPVIEGGRLWSINLRRATGRPKYVRVKGSRGALFGAENLLRAEMGLLCEGEFDAMLLDQEAGPRLGAATLGSASQRLDTALWGWFLLAPREVLVCYDNDAAGEAGARGLLKLGRRLRQVRLPPGPWKDIGEFMRQGGDVRAWSVGLLEGGVGQGVMSGVKAGEGERGAVLTGQG